MKYRILGTNGKVCCSGDIAEYLCDTCRSKVGLPPLRTTAAKPVDPYRAAMSSRANKRQAVLNNPAAWPDYDPHGTPPDPYAIHLAIRVLEAEDAAEEADNDRG